MPKNHFLLLSMLKMVVLLNSFEGAMKKFRTAWWIESSRVGL